MRFRTESAKTYHPKHTPEGSSFWPYGWIEDMALLKLLVTMLAYCTNVPFTELKNVLNIVWLLLLYSLAFV